jgi:hypothetical protein
MRHCRQGVRFAPARLAATGSLRTFRNAKMFGEPKPLRQISTVSARFSPGGR